MTDNPKGLGAGHLTYFVVACKGLAVIGIAALFKSSPLDMRARSSAILSGLSLWLALVLGPLLGGVGSQ